MSPVKHFAVLLKDQTILSARQIVPTAAGLEVRDEEARVVAILEAQNVELIVAKSEDEKFALEELSAQENERSRIASALLKVEHSVQAWEQFRMSKPSFAYRLPHVREFTIFGSGSLNLSLLPNRVSHDLDLATYEQAWLHLRDELGQIEVGRAQLRVALHTDNLFEYLTGWESRALTLTGASGFVFRVLHPLDTLSQKLLRQEESVFEAKDWHDIQAIMEKLKPEPAVLVGLLRQGYRRFFDDNESIRSGALRNARRFLQAFLPGKDLESDVIKPAQAKRSQQLAMQGLLAAPTKTPHLWQNLYDNRGLLESKPSAPKAGPKLG